MKLRTQLLLAAGIILFLPWAGYEYVQELDASLRQNQSRTLSGLGKTVTAILQSQPLSVDEAIPIDASRTLFAHTVAPVRIIMDGYNDDWSVGLHEGRELRFGENKVSAVNAAGANPAVVKIVAIRKTEFLYLFMQVRDNKVLYHNPQKREVASGDHVLLRTRDLVTDTQRDYFISGSAPGVAEARYQGKRVDGVRPIKLEKSINSVWQETVSGYNVEVRMPLPSQSTLLGVAVGDVDIIDATNNDIRWTGTFDPRDRHDIGRVVHINESLQSMLSGIAPDCGRMLFFDADGWLQAEAKGDCSTRLSLNSNSQSPSIFDALLQRIFEQILRRSNATELVYSVAGGRLSLPTGRVIAEGIFRQNDRGVDKLLSVTLPAAGSLSSGVVFIEQEVNSARSMATQALVKLFSITVLAALVVSISLLAYASVLSWRIRKLRDDTTAALADDGDIVHPTVSKSADEIGDLSRGLASMLARIQSYTDYQKSLASRLTHELRTPLTVASTSLESINTDQLTSSEMIQLERASSGIKQLTRILRSLSEATRLEQMIGDAVLEPLNIVEFMSAAHDAYASIYPSNVFTLSGVKDSQFAHVRGNAELLRQVLDKLIANAVEFSDEGGEIDLEVSSTSGQVALSVRNVGVPLPTSQIDLFSPMVSVRGGNSSSDEPASRAPHLGLGLYIARLIAEQHHGGLQLSNVADGVKATVLLPITE